MQLTGWARYPVVDARLCQPSDVSAMQSEIARASSAIARGAGRSYGDAAANPELTLSVLGMGRILDFDSSNGILQCEAGVTLREVLVQFLPKHWCPYVMPGTADVTVGGMVASDVHGKNQHREGSFGKWVESLDLLLSDGSVVQCSRAGNPSLFAATVGGMGLTGIILRVAFRLRRINSTAIQTEQIIAPHLAEAMDMLEQSLNCTYCVAWVDGLAAGQHAGRSIIYRGEHAVEAGENPNATKNIFGRRMKVPLDLPGFLINRFSTRAFNRLYLGRARLAPRRRNVPMSTFFFPLDRIVNWYKLYGRKGFLQFQCIVPRPVAFDSLDTILARVRNARIGSPLTVLKLMAAHQTGPIAFPMEGYSIAMDFPLTARSIALYRDLESIVRQAHGRIYLSKDALMSRPSFEVGYPRLDEFHASLAELPNPHFFQSAQSKRLGIGELTK